MQAQRKRILQMLEDGTISMEEALTLLENLQSEDAEQGEKPERPAPELTPVWPKEEKTGEDATGQKEKTSQQEDPSMDEFLDDLRRDFTVAGERFMQFMQTAIEKVKEVDLESPFGKSFVFSHTVTEEAEEVERVELAIPSGKVTVHATSEKEISAELTVKTYHRESKEEAKKEALDKIEVTNKSGVFSISSDVKLGQVDVDLYLPNQQYRKLEARLTNGAFKARGLKVAQIHVKTTNGAIQFNDITSESIEAETLNGRVYIDGAVTEVDAQSLNGAVVVTTTNEKAEKIQAKTVSGSVELYVPSTISLSGEIASTIGKLDLGLKDVERQTEQDQLFQKVVRFSKEVPEQSRSLRLIGKAQTGTVLVRYNV